VGSFPTIQEGEFEKEEQCGHKLDEEPHSSLDLNMTIDFISIYVVQFIPLFLSMILNSQQCLAENRSNN